MVVSPSTCPCCNHSVLCHRKGECVVPVVRRGMLTVCGCHAIQPPGSLGQQLDLDMTQPEIKQTVRRR